MPPALLAALRAELLARAAEADLAAAGIGREEDYTLDRSIRRTRITWFDQSTPTQQAFMAWAEHLRVALNQALMLGLFELEVCFALYPPGGRYERHLDSFAGARNRVVSLVVYLNEDWDRADGGTLAIWAEGAGPEAAPVAQIAPVGGDVVVMLSETIPHEVTVTQAERLGLAGWWRVNQSAPGRVDPPA